jgi:hypothetical protein
MLLLTGTTQYLKYTPALKCTNHFPPKQPLSTWPYLTPQSYPWNNTKLFPDRSVSRYSYSDLIGIPLAHLSDNWISK